MELSAAHSGNALVIPVETLALGENEATGLGQRPSFRISDLWRAPVHDLPLRDELLYQYLRLDGTMRLLEIGPGSGFTAFRLARRVRELTLVDVAAESVAHLGDELRGSANVRALCADACAPGLVHKTGGGYDAIYALDVFQYLPEPLACLQNMFEVLRPGGSLVVQWPNYRAMTPGLTRFETRAELDALMSSAGFRSWQLHAVRLRPHASFITDWFHKRPLSLYRQVRARRGSSEAFTYEGTWAFQARQGLTRYKWLMHACWAVLFAALRAGGPCFERVRLDGRNLSGNLLLLAKR